MKHFVLFYDYPPDFRERRAPFRPAHIAHANAAIGTGALQLGGAFADEPPMGLFLFKAEDAGDVENFARADPYVVNALVTSWRVREWTTVVGPGALTQI